MVLQRMYDEDYDYEFFYLDRYHVACKILPHHLVINLLNKKIYGIDFLNGLERECKILLTSCEKFNLELNLKQTLSFYLYIPERKMRLNSDESANTNHENTESNITPQTGSIIDNQDNVMSGNEDYTRQVTYLQ
jgi:hypothetical protein